MTTTAAIVIQYVDTHLHRQVVSAVATHRDGRRYRIGHLPGEGWFCTCTRPKACPHLRTLQDLIPGIAPPEQEAPPDAP